MSTVRTLAPLLLAASTFAQSPEGGMTINVEIDYMAVTSGPNAHSHMPLQAEVDALVQMFACHGITLNLVVDDQIAEVTNLQCPGEGGFFSCTGPGTFASIKAANFDNTGGGWHYCVFGHQYGGGSSTGIAEINGDDLLVTLYTGAGQNGNAFIRASTFAHELGHNLGLGHASPFSTSPGNSQPNYASVMSYQYQLDGVKTQMECLGLVDPGLHLLKDLDYSNGRLPSLDEAALDEAIGIGARTTDWDCDGSLDMGTVAQSIDGGDPWCGDTGAQTMLSDYDDWSNLVDSALTLTESDISVVSPPCASQAASPSSSFGPPDPSGCGGGFPTLTTESCVSGEMIWVDPTFVLASDGSGDNPYQSFGAAQSFGAVGSVVYLRPGLHLNSGVPIVLSKQMVWTSPGSASLAP